MRLKYVCILFSSLFLLMAERADAKILIDFENGNVSTIYNDVMIPGDKGTKFSLDQDHSYSNLTYYYRLSAGYIYKETHMISVLYAPLKTEYTFRAPKNIEFNGASFQKGENLKAEYKFNSYRIRYSYIFYKSENVKLRFGATGKIRDAYIKISGERESTKKENIGVVPLLNFGAEYRFLGSYAFEFDADALYSKYGRAEDAALALKYLFTENLELRVGNRILEGGADNSEVYTFTMFNYTFFAVTILF